MYTLCWPDVEIAPEKGEVYFLAPAGVKSPLLILTYSCPGLKSTSFRLMDPCGGSESAQEGLSSSFMPGSDCGLSWAERSEPEVQLIFVFYFFLKKESLENIPCHIQVQAR